MILQITFFLTLIVVLNFLLYLSINFNKNISYIILTFMIFLNFISVYFYKKQREVNKNQPKKEASAEDHPIIKVARQRLRK